MAFLGSLAAAAAWLLLLPALALATDRYVDNNKVGPGPPGCTDPADPCNTIAQATSAASSGDTIHVGGGGGTAYAGNVSLPNGVSLIKDSFTSPYDTSGAAIIGTTGAAASAVTLATGTAARTVSGFTLRGGATAGQGTLVVNSSTNLTISGNTFTDHSAGVTTQLHVIGGASGSQRITGNTFEGTNDGVTRYAIAWTTGVGGSPEIDHNSIDSFFIGIQVAATAPPAPPTVFNIHDNTVTNIYDDGPGGSIAEGISGILATGTVARNLVTQIPSQDDGEGIDLVTGVNGTGGQTFIQGNQVRGFHSFGGSFGGGDPFTITDSVYSNNGAALGFFGTSATATNVTATNSTGGFGYDVFMNDSTLALDSSIIGSAGVSSNGGCSSTFSMTTDGSPTCGLTPIGDPRFTNPAANDFSLLSDSALIDAGNPAAPAAGASDLVGHSRVIAVKGCPPRRDIGAYEFLPATELNCPAPSTPAKKKCKKKKKHRDASSAKKKRCKKKKRR
jgi:hypothetical protein